MDSSIDTISSYDEQLSVLQGRKVSLMLDINRLETQGIRLCVTWCSVMAVYYIAWIPFLSNDQVQHLILSPLTLVIAFLTLAALLMFPMKSMVPYSYDSYAENVPNRRTAVSLIGVYRYTKEILSDVDEEIDRIHSVIMGIEGYSVPEPGVLDLRAFFAELNNFTEDQQLTNLKYFQGILDADIRHQKTQRTRVILVWAVLLIVFFVLGYSVSNTYYWKKSDWILFSIACILAASIIVLVFPTKSNRSYLAYQDTPSIDLEDRSLIGHRRNVFGLLEEYGQTRELLSRVDRELEAIKSHSKAERLKSKIGRKEYLEQELNYVSDAAAREFFGNDQRYDQSAKMRTEALEILADPERSNLETELADAQSLITSINELILREQDDKRSQRRWYYAALVIMFLYIAIISAPVWIPIVFPSTAASYYNSDGTLKDWDGVRIAIYGIPIWVIMYGAVGSLAAILFRFYSETHRVTFSREFRWLIARPITGIIMSAIMYLAVTSGFMLLSSPVDSNSFELTPTQFAVLSIVAFLAGFSDKFYNRVIDLLVERVAGPDKADDDESSKKSEKSTTDKNDLEKL